VAPAGAGVNPAKTQTPGSGSAERGGGGVRRSAIGPLLKALRAQANEGS
jgi:hypothetical protein